MTDDLKAAPKLDPNCQCICHTQPGVMHVVACCSAPDDLKARGVRVRKLEWSARSDGFWVASDELGLHYALTEYRGMEDPFKLEGRGGFFFKTDYFDTLEAAKAAAQADYESRILAALEISDE